ncbi:hypothetical protein DSO57_1010645 [Entomophthora muscae]|uniref:Uncharacterized protein n=1 Tax=Entomophthora muscae TaxID=34485 RepID=A0ACC2RXH8_9FUNG|nr:hypothetical protein DSO57_1010645 [Entomophthora muscae]
MQVGGPTVYRPSGPKESRFGVQFLLPGMGFQRGRIVNPDTIPFFPQGPSLLILLVQVELDNFLGIIQVAQQLPSTFF